MGLPRLPTAADYLPHADSERTLNFASSDSLILATLRDNKCQSQERPRVRSSEEEEGCCFPLLLLVAVGAVW